MEKKSEASLNHKRTSKELLSVTGDGSQSCVIKSLFKNKEIVSPQNRKPLQTFRVERSPLLSRLQEFLPKLEKSTSEILEKPEHERDEMDIENIEGCNTVVEMNILLGETNSSDSDSDSDQEEATPTINSDNFKINQNNPKNIKKKVLITKVEDLNKEELKIKEDR